MNLVARPGEPPLVQALWGEECWLIQHTQTYCQTGTHQPLAHFTPFLFLPWAGHGVDSRPAMAIFELLDYIVNEVGT